QPRQDPFLRIRHRRVPAAGVDAFGVHQYEAGGVPELVAEVAVAVGPAQVELDVAAGAGEGGHGEAQGVGAVGGDALGEFAPGGLLDLRRVLRAHQPGGALGHQVLDGNAVDDVQRVEDVSLGFGHLLAVAVAHQAGDVDVPERDLAGQAVGHHDHPGDPEEDDVKARDQYAGGQEVREPALGHRGLVGPAHGAERPQRGGEPGFQHVAVLAQWHVVAQAGAAARLGLVAADVNVAGIVVPGRDPVPPPQLPADGPVLDVLQPVAVGVDPVGRHELDRAVLHQLQAAPAHLVHRHEPLVGQVRLDHLAAAVAARHLQLVRPGFNQQAFGFQVRQHR